MEKRKNIYTIVVTTVMLIAIASTYADAKSSIDIEISKIKSASPKERVKLMNALKRKIFRLNRAQRIQAIRKLRSSIASASTPRVNSRVSKRQSISRAYSSNTHQSLPQADTIEHLRSRIEGMNHHPITSIIHDIGNPRSHHKRVDRVVKQSIAKPSHDIAITSQKEVSNATTHITTPPTPKEPTVIDTQTNVVKEIVTNSANSMQQEANNIQTSVKSSINSADIKEPTRVDTPTQVSNSAKDIPQNRPTNSIEHTQTKEVSQTTHIESTPKEVEVTHIESTPKEPTHINSAPKEPESPQTHIEPTQEQRVSHIEASSSRGAEASHGRDSSRNRSLRRLLFIQNRGMH